MSIGVLLRFEHAVPEDLENIFTLSGILLLFQVSNMLLPESGIVAVIVAGLTVGNLHIERASELREFKEQLTVLMISLLFVLLAADVRFEQLVSLGKPGLATVALLMLLVRPLNVFLSTVGCGLNTREKLFMSWLAPRGIVAAAVAALFAVSLDEAGIPGGSELRALVFLVIALTVAIQGVTGGWVAGRLGLRRAKDTGYAIGRCQLARSGARQDPGERRAGGAVSRLEPELLPGGRGARLPGHLRQRPVGEDPGARRARHQARLDRDHLERQPQLRLRAAARCASTGSATSGSLSTARTAA